MRSEDLITAYTNHQRGRGLSPHTVRRRDVSLRAFARHVHPAGLDTATTVLVEDWLHSYRCPTTRRAYLLYPVRLLTRLSRDVVVR